LTENYKLEKRLTELECHHGKTRERLVDFMSLVEATIAAAAFDQAFNPAGGFMVMMIVLAICYVIAKRLNLWLMRDS
jgi:hypothetical protein